MQWKVSFTPFYFITFDSFLLASPSELKMNQTFPKQKGNKVVSLYSEAVQIANSSSIEENNVIHKSSYSKMLSFQARMWQIGGTYLPRPCSLQTSELCKRLVQRKCILRNLQFEITSQHIKFYNQQQ